MPTEPAPEKAVVALDLGGTRIKLGLVRNGQLLVSHELDSQSAGGLAARLPELTERIDALLIETNTSPADVAGIGMATPGIVDTMANKVLSINDKYSDAPTLDLPGWARATWNWPLRLENDTRAALLGEWRYGNGRGYDNVVLMMLGTGIGTSAIIEGRLLRGKHFQAGILGGHFVVNQHGNRCNCGTVGCAEAEASTWDLGRRLANDIRLANSLLRSCERLDFKAIFQCAEQGDALAIDVRDRCIGVWAACALNLIRAYDPDVLILGGGIMGSQAVIIPPIQQTLDQNTWATWGNVAVVPASLIHSAALLGVSTLYDPD